MRPHLAPGLVSLSLIIPNNPEWLLQCNNQHAAYSNGMMIVAVVLTQNHAIMTNVVVAHVRKTAINHQRKQEGIAGIVAVMTNIQSAEMTAKSVAICAQIRRKGHERRKLGLSILQSPGCCR